MLECDHWQSKEVKQLVQSIRNRLPVGGKHLKITTVSASPRQARLLNDGRVRSELCPPQIECLRKVLMDLLNSQGDLLLTLNTLRQADHLYQLIKFGRLKNSKTAAQDLIGKFAAIKASGVAVNPLLMLDFATGIACDTALVVQLGKLYGLQIISLLFR